MANLSQFCQVVWTVKWVKNQVDGFDNVSEYICHTFGHSGEIYQISRTVRTAKTTTNLANSANILYNVN